MRRLQIIALTIVVLAITACGSTVKPLTAWQTSVESYISEQANGDYNALRNVSSNDRPSLKSFRAINASTSGIPIVAPTQTDVNGLLLAQRNINGNNWYIFLVGTVKYDGKFKNIPLDDPSVKDVRLIALTGDLGNPTWAIGSGSDVAIDQYYRNTNSSFPNGTEAFEVAIAGQQITVVDQQSQAQWMLDIPAQMN